MLQAALGYVPPPAAAAALGEGGERGRYLGEQTHRGLTCPWVHSTAAMDLTCTSNAILGPSIRQAVCTQTGRELQQ